MDWHTDLDLFVFFIIFFFQQYLDLFSYFLTISIYICF